MDATNRGPNQHSLEELPRRSFMGMVILLTVALGIVGAIGYLIVQGPGVETSFFASRNPTPQPNTGLTASQTSPLAAEVRLTREGIDRLLDALDQAIRRKDVEGVLRHIAHDATITIHLKQGPQQQAALLTREEYRKTLAMSFAFPSDHDFARTNTSVSLAADERSAKVSFKSTETLRPSNHEFKAEGEETLVFNIRDGKPMITSLEQTFPGDSM